MTYVLDLIRQLEADKKERLEQIETIRAEVRSIDGLLLTLRPPVADPPASQVIPPPLAERRAARLRRRTPKLGGRTKGTLRMKRGGRTAEEWFELIEANFPENEFSITEVLATVGQSTSLVMQDNLRNILKDALIPLGRVVRLSAKGESPVKYQLAQQYIRVDKSKRARSLQDAIAAFDASERAQHVGGDDGSTVERGRPVAGTGRHNSRNSALAALKPDVRKAVQPAIVAGWVAERMGDDHIRFTHPRKPGFFKAPCTPSSARTLHNLRSAMVQAGAPV